ncbi:hypothetical protein QEN19_001033 [Hanseniaspora menglaensis]
MFKKAVFETSVQLRLVSTVTQTKIPTQEMISKLIANKSVNQMKVQEIYNEIERLYPKDATVTSENIPYNIKSLYYAPRRNLRTKNELVASLVFKSYDKKNLDFMADFALRAGFYAGAVMSSPVYLKKEKTLYTFNRSPFAQAKSKQNFVKIEKKIKIDIFDTAPEALDLLFSYIMKYPKHAVSMDVQNYTRQTLEGSFVDGLPSNKYMAEALKEDELYQQIEPLAKSELAQQLLHNEEQDTDKIEHSDNEVMEKLIEERANEILQNDTNMKKYIEEESVKK